MITNLLVGAAKYSFIDGLAIAIGYSTATELGVVTTIAVLFHEAASLMPELQHERGLRQSVTQMTLLVTGSLFMFVFSGVSTLLTSFDQAGRQIEI
jgi:zinc transporter ZupT